ncbi:hypothetical protein NE237_013857 [Protea cynaroides]|uniref:FCP1 homology domain-containing protein n=1 Tax=Protea cynaroides TaxID=273540 RepID=A0A9Q0H0Q0_9MAGN|nr:hypothetical protein NE237_013857 [Protea cynaroides]
MTYTGETLTLGSNEVARKQKKKGEKRKHTFCLYSERDLKEKLEDMDINIENEKKRKQSLDENLKISNAFILALKAPVNANIESALQTLGNNTERSSCVKNKRKKKNHKIAETNSLAEKLPKVGNLGERFTDDLALKAPFNGNIETDMQLQTTVNKTEWISCRKNKRKKKKHKAVENNSPLQELREVGILGERVLKDIEDVIIKTEKQKSRKQSVDENFEVSNSEDLALKKPVNGNIEMCLQTADNNIEEGSSRGKKRRKKKHKDVANNSPVQKLPEVGSLNEQVQKKLKDMEINIMKEKMRKKSVDENLEFSDIDYLSLKSPVNQSMEMALQTAENNTEGSSGRKRKRKKKKHKVVESNSPVQRLLEDGNLDEQDMRELEDVEINTVQEKKSRHVLNENMDISNADDLYLRSLVNESIKMALQTAEKSTVGSSSWKKKRKDKKCKALENNSSEKRLLEGVNPCEQYGKELENVEINMDKKWKIKESLNENKVISKVDDVTMKAPIRNIEMDIQTTENNAEGSSRQKNERRMKKKSKTVEINEPLQELIESGNPYDQDLKNIEHLEIVNHEVSMGNTLNLVVLESVDTDLKKNDKLAETSAINGKEKRRKRKKKRLLCSSPGTTEPAYVKQTAHNSSGEVSVSYAPQLVLQSQPAEINEPLQELIESGNPYDQDLKNIEHLVKVNHEVSMGNALNLVVLESVDTDLKKNDKLAQSSSINNGKEKRRKRKKKRFLCSSASTAEPAHVMQTAHNSSGEVSVSCSDNLHSSKNELGNNKKNRENGDELNEAQKSVGEHGISEERNFEELPNKLHSWSESKSEIDNLAGSANMLMVVENSPFRDVSVNCSDHTLVLERNEGSIHVKQVNGTVDGSGVLKVEDMSMLKTTEENLLNENEDELNKLQITVQDNEFSGKPSVEEFLTYCDKVEKSSLETANNMDSVAHILLHLRQGKYNSSESCEGGLNTQLQSVKNISVGEFSANGAYKSPAPGKGVKKKKKVHHALHDSPYNPFPKQLEQKNKEIINESVQLDKVTDRCHVLTEENLEVSITELKREEMISSCNVSVMEDDISVGAISKKDNLLEKLPRLEERSPCSTRKKLLILDLNGLLVDIVSVSPKGFKVDKKIGKKSLFKRAYCDEFLKFCFERFDVGVWSSRHKKNVDGVVDFLMKDLKHKLLFCWDQSHCTDTGFKTIENKHKPFVLKELKKLWDKHDPNFPWEKGEYNESNTLLVDDSPYKALCNPPNTAIFPCSYSFLDTEDSSLGFGGDLRVYLERLSMAEDVQKYVKEHPFGQCAITSKNPSWSFYSKVLGAKISESVKTRKSVIECKVADQSQLLDANVELSDKNAKAASAQKMKIARESR